MERLDDDTLADLLLAFLAFAERARSAQRVCRRWHRLVRTHVCNLWPDEPRCAAPVAAAAPAAAAGVVCLRVHLCGLPALPRPLGCLALAAGTLRHLEVQCAGRCPRLGDLADAIAGAAPHLLTLDVDVSWTLNTAGAGGAGAGSAAGGAAGGAAGARRWWSVAAVVPDVRVGLAGLGADDGLLPLHHHACAPRWLRLRVGLAANPGVTDAGLRRLLALAAAAPALADLAVDASRTAVRDPATALALAFGHRPRPVPLRRLTVRCDGDRHWAWPDPATAAAAAGDAAGVVRLAPPPAAAGAEHLLFTAALRRVYIVARPAWHGLRCLRLALDATDLGVGVGGCRALGRALAGSAATLHTLELGLARNRLRDDHLRALADAGLAALGALGALTFDVADNDVSVRGLTVVVRAAGRASAVLEDCAVCATGNRRVRLSALHALPTALARADRPRPRADCTLWLRADGADGATLQSAVAVLGTGAGAR